MKGCANCEAPVADAEAIRIADDKPTSDGRWRLTSHLRIGNEYVLISTVEVPRIGAWLEEFNRYETVVLRANAEGIVTYRRGLHEESHSYEESARKHHLDTVAAWLAKDEVTS